MEHNTAQNQYPIILVHGIALKDFKFFRAFGLVEKNLKKCSFDVYTAKIDGFGAVETNAKQLKTYLEKLLAKLNVEKVNLIAHSKGGLDCKYMIEYLDMADRVASLTTICTPHQGSPIASFILKLPRWLTKFIAFWINLWYRIFGDKHPNALKVCQQLQTQNAGLNGEINFTDKVYCQSYSTILKRSRDDIIMGIPLHLFKRIDGSPSDGLVSTDSAKFGDYKVGLADESVSHSEIAGFSISKRKRKLVYKFYLELCEDLVSRGY